MRGRRGPAGAGLLSGLALAGLALAQVAPPPAPPPAPPARPAPAPPPGAATPAPPAPGPAAPAPGRPAPPEVVAELRGTLARAVERFEARDLDGVMALVSEQYKTGPFTKATVRAQLAAMFGVYDAMRAKVRIDDVRLIGDRAWVYSTGEAAGRLPFVGQWVTILWWERELEIARRESGGWRLFGYQQ